MSTDANPPHITLLYFAQVSHDLGIDTERFAFIQGETASGLLQRVCTQHDYTLSLSDVRIAVNETFVDGDTPIQAGDVVAIIPPVAGG